MRFRYRRIPLVAALLNFFIWGLGYVYNGRRVAFGIMLVAASLLLVATSLQLPQETAQEMNRALFFPGLIISAAFAYDAFAECKSLQKRKKPEWELS